MNEIQVRTGHEQRVEGFERGLCFSSPMIWRAKDTTQVSGIGWCRPRRTPKAEVGKSVSTVGTSGREL
jgi:hypothetical protein